MASKVKKQQSSEFLSRLFLGHKLKVLNLSLIFYLCLGTFIFDYLDNGFGLKSTQNVAQEKKESTLKEDDKISRKSVSSLGELRLSSVRRMWNITNQLNILYEANWTNLVLEELIQFENRLIESISRIDGSEIFESELEEDLNKNKKEKRRKSIKKSLIYSLATVTTIGPACQGSNATESVKLVTILYGALGVPLLFFTISQTGKQMAQSMLNSLIIIRHYCFALPAYYLCCSCNLQQCFRLLSWCFCCCCCCCCKYLFCSSDKIFGNNKKQDQRKASKAPQLKLRKRVSRAPPGGATETTNQYPPPHTAYVIGNDINHLSAGQQQKSVRFIQGTPSSQREEIEVEKCVGREENDDDDEGSYFSLSTLMTSVILLIIYFLIGSYVYLKQGATLVDSMYDCYLMLSMSKLSDSFHNLINDPLSFYKLLKSNPTKSPSKIMQNLSSDEKGYLLDPLIWNTIYLFFGLNLVSMCAHFARLCLFKRHEKADISSELSLSASSKCNGHISLMGTLSDNKASPFNDNSGQIVTIGKQETEFMLEAPSSVDLQPAQMDLSELYIVNGPESVPSAAFTGNNHQTSDVSFASDRSTGSLCLHHHHHHHQTAPQNSTNSSSYYPALNEHISHLYLPPSTLATNQQQHITMNGDEVDDSDELERMLKSCTLNKKSGQQANKLRASSSSIHLSGANSKLSQAGERRQETGLIRSIRAQNNGCYEQDNSLNTNTTSSVSSLRTIKLHSKHNFHTNNGTQENVVGAFLINDNQ